MTLRFIVAVREGTGMMTTEAQAKTIDGRARTVRELLDKAKYAIDFYQREYAWQERQVRELIDDLTGGAITEAIRSCTPQGAFGSTALAHALNVCKT